MPIQLPWLDPDNLDFPSVDLALEEPNGLLAAGGDLRPERILAAYRRGIFPWYESGQPILWWCPKPRTVFDLQDIKISRSLKKNIKNGGFRFTFDEAFETVIKSCAKPRTKSLNDKIENIEHIDTDQGTWITDDMIDAYVRLHHMGHAHSAECWRGQELVGGLYGINIGKVFFGESMFSKASNASKVALICMSLQLENWGFPIIDCQLENPHLSSLGAKEMNFDSFHAILNQYCDKTAPKKPWVFDDTLLRAL